MTNPSINDYNLNGESLFDPRAASTQYNVEFGKDMKNFRTEDPYLNKWSGTNQWRSREEMKDVVYNSGKVELTVSPGGAFERFMLHQGDPDNPIFDTGEWRTQDGYTRYDYDKFIIEYGPDQDTTFQFVPNSQG